MKRITALSTNTYNTQQAVWDRIKKLDKLKYIITIGCESYGLQLIIKDLLNPGKDDQKQDIQSALCDFWKEETSIISFFHKAPKQLGILRKKQWQLLKKHVALSSAGLTRWGTQVCS
jgi:hypothetical protein